MKYSSSSGSNDKIKSKVIINQTLQIIKRIISRLYHIVYQMMRLHCQEVNKINLGKKENNEEDKDFKKFYEEMNKKLLFYK